MPATTCHFCRSAAESRTKDNRFACCRKCCFEKLLPLIASAVGPVELAQAANRLATDPGAAVAGPKPMVPEADKLTRLIYGDRRGAEMSRGTGTPAAPTALRRRMTKQEQALAVARYMARQNCEVLDVDIRRSVAKAGLKTYGGAELSTVTAGTSTTTRTPARPATKGKVPSKADIQEMIRRAGLTPVA
jgi:hypothetical protein